MSNESKKVYLLRDIDSGKWFKKKLNTGLYRQKYDLVDDPEHATMFAKPGPAKCSAAIKRKHKFEVYEGETMVMIICKL